MRRETFEELERALDATTEELGRQIVWLATTADTPADHQVGVQLVERARQKRDVAARALRLARVRHLRGHPQAGGPTT